MLLISFIACPAPGGPQRVTSLAKYSRSGLTRGKCVSLQPTITESLPSSAAARVRATGASTKWMPRAEKRPSRSRVRPTGMVLKSMM